MAYTSTGLTLAMLEFLAHIWVDDLDPKSPPALRYVRAELDDGALERLAERRLPPDWNAVPARQSTAEIGDNWARSGRSLGLIVPSIHLPLDERVTERNVLINPLHPAFRAIKHVTRPFDYDRRLLRR